jgi:hypothetical protein
MVYQDVLTTDLKVCPNITGTIWDSGTKACLECEVWKAKKAMEDKGVS